MKLAVPSVSTAAYFVAEGLVMRLAQTARHADRSEVSMLAQAMLETLGVDNVDATVVLEVLASLRGKHGEAVSQEVGFLAVHALAPLIEVARKAPKRGRRRRS